MLVFAMLHVSVEVQVRYRHQNNNRNGYIFRYTKRAQSMQADELEEILGTMVVVVVEAL